MARLATPSACVHSSGALSLGTGEVGGGKDAVLPTTERRAPADVVGAVQVQPAIGPLSRLDIGHEMLDGENGIEDVVYPALCAANCALSRCALKVRISTSL